MPKQVTYGVSGLIDWCAMIPISKARLRVHFTGGALTKYGVTPAEFTTSDALTQRIIEDSHYYRSGKITTLRSTGRADTQPLSRKNDMATKAAYESSSLPISADAKTEQQKTIYVSCLEDAIEYMRENYNLSSVMMRTPESLKALASQYGITFSFPT